MHGLDVIIARNARAQERSENAEKLRDELAHNRELLEDVPELSPYEQQVLHYSNILERIAAGESWDHVAMECGPTWDKAAAERVSAERKVA